MFFLFFSFVTYLANNQGRICFGFYFNKILHKLTCPSHIGQDSSNPTWKLEKKTIESRTNSLPTHILIRAISERFLPTHVTSNGSHWPYELLKMGP